MAKASGLPAVKSVVKMGGKKVRNKGQKVARKPVWREWAESILMAVLLATFIMVFLGRSYVVNGESMEPTLHDGQRLIVDKISYRFTEPARGEIIVFRMPAHPYIKRIIAVEGDTVEAHSGKVFVNGKPLNEPYVVYHTNLNWGPVVVPEDHFWVMGDNRPNSDDSRGTVGFLSRKKIIGRAIFRYWPLSKIGLVGGVH